MNMIFSDVFTEIAVLLLAATFIGAIGLRFKQPLIVSFIVVGILVGPSVLGWVSANDQVDLFAQLGIALLLFVVGLKLDLHIIRSMGLIALATGLGQVIFTSVVGFSIAIAMGMTQITALYVAVALTFSSTIIIVKLLSDKREVDTLHGKIAVGFLIVQDIVVVLVMILLTALGNTDEQGGFAWEAAETLFKGLIFLAILGLLMRYAITPLLDRLARSPELLILYAIAWAVALGALGVYLGFGKEVGAFLAGVSLASTPYREVIGARLVSLRDFLLLFFFIDLGAGLALDTLTAQVLPAIIFSLFVLIGNPLIVMIILGYMGYRKRTGFLSGLTVAQISEFSLILAALGLSLNHINSDTVGMITLVGLITISASTYLIIYSQHIYGVLAKWLDIFERKDPFRENKFNDNSADISYDVILFGLGRFGFGVAEKLQQHSIRVLAVDFDPDTVRRCQTQGLTVKYGDAEAPEFLSTLPLAKTKWVMSSLRDIPVNFALLHALRELRYHGKTAVTADTESHAAQLRKAGANKVVMPFDRAATDVAAILSELSPSRPPKAVVIQTG